MKNLKYLHYTFLHRYALQFVIEKHIKDKYDKEALLRRAKYHDLDKALLYTLIEKKQASEYHRQFSSHHFDKSNLTSKSRLDFLEAVMDFECAGYTKADKPRNAYDTIMTFDYICQDKLLETVQELGIDRSYTNTTDDSDWKKYLVKMPEITEDYMLRYIYMWIADNSDESKYVIDYANTVLCNN